MKLRADLIAIPKDDKFCEQLFAFEVKIPDGTWHYAHWSDTIRQAENYVYGLIDSSHVMGGRFVTAAFVYPFPDIFGPCRDDPPIIRAGDEPMLQGALNLALHLRVGRAFSDFHHRAPRFTLAFGPNEVWREDVGFLPGGTGLLKGRRRFGSRKVDVLKELGVRTNFRDPDP